MDSCVLIGFAVILALLSISLIGIWNSNLSRGVKSAFTLISIISASSFVCAYYRCAFFINDEVSFLGVIIAIVSIPIAVLMGWNIHTVIDFNKKTEEIIRKTRAIMEENDRNKEVVNESINGIKNELLEIKKALSIRKVYVKGNMLVKTKKFIYKNLIMCASEDNQKDSDAIYDGDLIIEQEKYMPYTDFYVQGEITYIVEQD